DLVVQGEIIVDKDHLLRKAGSQEKPDKHQPFVLKRGVENSVQVSRRRKLSNVVCGERQLALPREGDAVAIIEINSKPLELTRSFCDERSSGGREHHEPKVSFYLVGLLKLS